MYHQCTTEKTANQQQIFCDALYSAMHERLYADITITDLCNQTRLSRNIFYRLFDCKDDVLYANIEEIFVSVSKELIASLLGKVEMPTSGLDITTIANKANELAIIENVKKFIASTVEGYNYDINAIDENSLDIEDLEE